MANRSRAVFNEAALSRYLATNSGYRERRSRKLEIELRIRARAKTGDAIRLPRAIGWHRRRWSHHTVYL